MFLTLGNWLVIVNWLILRRDSADVADIFGRVWHLRNLVSVDDDAGSGVLDRRRPCRLPDAPYVQQRSLTSTLSVTGDDWCTAASWAR